MNGTLSRSIGRQMHQDLEITTAHDLLVEGATVDVQPDEAAKKLVGLGLLSPSSVKPADPEKVKAVAKEPAIAQGK